MDHFGCTKLYPLILAFLMSGLVVSSRASAQGIPTSVLGSVRDPSGAVVSAVTVRLLHLSTHSQRTTTTDSWGNFSFAAVDIGEYDVSVQKNGFKTEVRKGVRVSLLQKVRLDFVLELGAVHEFIEIRSNGVNLGTDQMSLGQSIEAQAIVELPLKGRNLGGLLVLVPGVQYGISRVDFDGQGGAPIPGNAVAVSANGQREVNQQITLDGVIATEPRLNTMIFSPSLDAIAEVQVQTGSYSAEFGQNNGALVQLAIKGGGTRLRGTLFEFNRDDRFAARDYFLDFQAPPGTPRSPKNILRRNQFGAFLSGPVLFRKYQQSQPRTFWSFNYEGRRETRESVQEAFWFPEAFRKGDFSALLRPPLVNGRPIRSPVLVYDSLTGEPFRDASGSPTNIIPPERINRNAQNYVNRFQPLPDFERLDVLALNVQRKVPQWIRSNQLFFRVDHHLGSEGKLFVRYAGDRSRWTRNNLNPHVPVFVRSAVNQWAFQHTHAFSSRMLNEFRYGFNQSDDDTYNPRTNTDFDLDSLGIGPFRVATDGNRKLTAREAGLPATLIGGDSDASSGYNFSTTHQFSENLSWMRGRHSFKAGMEFWRVRLDRGAGNQPRGRINVSASEAGYQLAGWLLGYPASSVTAEGMPFSAPRQNRWSAYLLDDWQVSRKLTFNLGLRWDLFQVPLDSAGSWRSLRLDVLTRASDGRLLPTLVPQANTGNFSFYRSDNRYFMPRLGLAYRIAEKWVARSGFGWFANAQQLNNFTILNLNPPKSGTFSFNQVTDAAQTVSYDYAGQTYRLATRRIRPGTQALTVENAFPGAGTSPARTNLLLLPPDNKASNHVQWSLDLQRELPWRSVLSVAYVGSKTSHLDNSIANFNSPDPSANTDINTRRPYQAFVSEGEDREARPLGTIRYLDSFANANYHALQVTLNRHFHRGFLYGLAYTYGKALGEGYGRNESSGDVSAGYQNPRDRRSSRSRYGFDVTHNAVIHYVHELPWLKNRKGSLAAFFGGWQSSGVLTLRTGFPLGVQGGTLNTGGDSRPDRIADGRIGGEATRERWFDPLAFRRTDCNIPSRPDLCHYGNAGQGILISPGSRNFDLGLAKNWSLPFLGEQGRLQFRAELFNAFNTPQFGRPIGIGFTSPTSDIPDGAQMGEIRETRLPMRVVQFGLKMYF